MWIQLLRELHIFAQIFPLYKHISIQAFVQLISHSPIPLSLSVLALFLISFILIFFSISGRQNEHVAKRGLACKRKEEEGKAVFGKES